MAPTDVARAYIYRLCNEIGANADSIYNAKTGAWYFSSGSSTIEVFLTTIGIGQQSERTFIRCFAPIYTVPGDPVKQLGILQSAMEINTERMGIKLGALPDKGFLCAVSERDIEGMDYGEFITIMQDISYWCDHLRHYFEKKFGKLQ